MTATGKEKRTVIVTGASAGVGRATAKALVKEHGCTVIAISRNAPAENSSRVKPTGQLRPLALDLV